MCAIIDMVNIVDYVKKLSRLSTIAEKRSQKATSIFMAVRRELNRPASLRRGAGLEQTITWRK